MSRAFRIATLRTSTFDRPVLEAHNAPRAPLEFAGLLACCFACFELGACFDANVARAAEPLEKAWTVDSTAGAFITAITTDQAGGIWVAAEDKGVSRRNPEGTWENFHERTGLRDRHAYALACDQHGRIWAGLANHGVSVFAEGAWTNYDAPFGPAGERVFAIACHPRDGDVWMATNRGLTRWLAAEDRWQHFTTNDGLPEVPISLAFESQGALLAGLPTQGVARADGAGKYKRWQQVSGPAPDELPLTPTGAGLPCGLVNGIAISEQGHVFIATCAGLAMRSSNSATWRFVRGEDYVDRVRLRARPGRQPIQTPLLPSLLPADYITVVACSPDDRLWVGTRESGFGTYVPGAGVQQWFSEARSGHAQNFATAFCFAPDGHVWIGTYGGGVLRSREPLIAPAVDDSAKVLKRTTQKQPSSIAPAGSLSAPRPASAPLASDLVNARIALEKAILAIPPSRRAPPAVASLDDLAGYDSPKATPQAMVAADDWRTQGDFYGERPLVDYRYGEWLAYLCAHSAPNDVQWGGWPTGLRGRLGAHATKDDSLRHWVHWPSTRDRRSLKNPYGGGRRQAEWDDHGEAYSLNHEGPHVYVDVHIPAGVHRMALYFFNKDGHDKRNRLRDYLITVKPLAENDAAYAKSPVLARSRVRDFWSGVYKTFTVAGPASYTIEIHDNQSHNVIVSGVFYDPLSVQPLTESGDGYIPRVGLEVPALTQAPGFADDCPDENVREAIRLWQTLKTMRIRDPWAARQAFADNGAGVLRTLLAAQGRNCPLGPRALQVLAECHAELCQYDQRDAIYRLLAQQEYRP
jgi:sugar lactone lactonase YvrE